MPPLAVFRCDASPTIGGGHATRSLALADALTAAGWETIFAAGPESTAIIPALARHRVMVLRRDAGGEPAEIGAKISRPADWLVVDHHERGIEFETACREWAKQILVITDFTDRKHDCELLLDQTIGRDMAAESGIHVPLVPKHCKLLLGMNYALVRDQFTRRRQEAIKHRTRRRKARRLLLSFGATDPFGLTLRLLKALLEYPAPFTFDVVSGIAPPEQLSSLSALRHDRVTLRHSVEDMASLMAAADLAIGLAGTSASERCALGLPSALFVPSEHYREISERLERAGAAALMGREVFDADAASAKIMALADDDDGLARMSAAAFSLCDGLGASRVAAEMRALTGKLR